jgi:hypothetical protein
MKWHDQVKMVIDEYRLTPDDEIAWLFSHPEEKAFLANASLTDTNHAAGTTYKPPNHARMIMCDTFDTDTPTSPFPLSRGYPRRPGRTCAPGYRSTGGDKWCVVE